ncbi:MAG: glycosyltransferase [Methylacidiphilales bacterium]|nr:glycosyltransferase [Candidatus Methylacidiphilales bacterium]
MKELPLITLGLPAYGRPAFLREAIKSCLAQDYPNLEILVADDASPQDPWPGIADLASEKWNYVRHAKNKGGTANFNYLIEKACGEIFVLHQDDDCLHPEFCRRAAEAMEGRPEAVLYSGLMFRGPKRISILGQDLKTFNGPWVPLDYLEAGAHVVESLDALLMLLFSIPFMHPATAMRRDVLVQTGGYFNESMFIGDNITFSRMLLHGPAIYDTRLSGFFRLHQTNVSTSLDLSKQYAWRRRQLDLLLPLIKEKFSNWQPRLAELLQNLPRRERWRILTEALEAGYPKELNETVAQAVGGNARKNLLRARVLKASWSQQWKSLGSRLIK